MSNSTPWANTYTEYGINPEITLPAADSSLLDVFESSFSQYSQRNAYVFMGKHLTYQQLEWRSQYFASYLQSLGLSAGARVAIMLPNVLQYPIAALGVLRAGFILVNVNPLYTARELSHQLRDSGAEVLIILENFAHVYADITDPLPTKTVIVTGVGDLLGLVKGLLVNSVLRYVKKQVPAYTINHAVSFKLALQKGAGLAYTRPNIKLHDTAVLQYTGGTTGVSKGAELLHSNIIANILQVNALFDAAMGKNNQETQTILCALPLYHIFAFTLCAMYGLRRGALNVLIANPRDIPGLVDHIGTYKPHLIPAVNTLFNALINNAKFKTLDFSNLRIAMGGGMAVLPATASAWKAITGMPIIEGYGLSETSPVATANPPTNPDYTGSIGIPMPSTTIALFDDNGQPVPIGERGEIAIKGPQVMKGYWQRPEATAESIDANGYFKSGDIGVMDTNGYIKIVDRKKDMILVSGFNVYPNEIEAVVSLHPKVLEVACIGVPDEKSGEVPKIFIVKKDPTLTTEEILAYCEQELTGYKKPRQVQFMTELPKSNVGKILRKDLRAPSA